MKKSLFWKQFVLYMSILILSFMILGFVFATSFEAYFMNQKESQLLMQGEKISNQYSLMYYTGAINIRQLSLELRILEDYIHAKTLLIDNEKRINIVSSGIDPDWIGEVISQDEIDKVLMGETVKIKGGRFGGIFTEPTLMVGYPIIVDEKVCGAIFMSTSMPEIQKSISEVYRIILISLGFSAATAFILIWSSIKGISKPLLEMNNAAQIIANGDFEKRISIQSQDEVGQLAASFNEMAKSLSEQEQVRRDFISNISHDIRSPMTSIQGFLNAILDGTIPEEKKEYYLQIVLDETKRITKMANDILDLNQIENKSSVLEITEFDINELLRNILMQFETRVREKKLSLKLILAQKATIVAADRERIRRVFYNLIDNAIKFCEEEKAVAIETILKPGKIYVSVKDEGIGLSEEEIKCVFDRFYKADISRGMDTGGTGLGLSIVKEFVKAHGETIEVKSQIGAGCEFIISLALANNKEE